MKVVVTGATGAFGAPLCAALSAQDVDVVALARRRPALLPPGVRFEPADVTDAGSLDPLVRDADVVVHLAWLLASDRDPDHTRSLNLGGTTNVLEAMARSGVPRLVFASSVMAYGSDPARRSPYREDDPLRATLTYGAHKREAEELIASSGIPATVVRPAPVLGRGVRNSVSDVFATPAIIGSTIVDTPWQLVHQDDVTRFLVDAVVHEWVGTVNLAADDVVPLSEVGVLLDKRVARLTPRALEMSARALWSLHLSDIDPAGVDAIAALPVADTSRLRDERGFRCAWSTRDTFLDAHRALRRYVVLGSKTRESRRGLPLPPAATTTALPPSLTVEEVDHLAAAAAPVIASVVGGRRVDQRVGHEVDAVRRDLEAARSHGVHDADAVDARRRRLFDIAVDARTVALVAALTGGERAGAAALADAAVEAFRA